MRYVLLLAVLMLAGCKVSVEVPSFEPIRLETPVDLSTHNDAPAQAELELEPIVPQAPAPPPVIPATKRKHIVQYTLRGCKPCENDRLRVIPKWVEKGWNFDPKQDVIDESKNPKGSYPRYDIYDENGRKTVHYGTLITLKP